MARKRKRGAKKRPSRWNVLRADVAPKAAPARKRSVPVHVAQEIRENKERVQKWRVFRQPSEVEEVLYDNDAKPCGRVLLIDRETAKHSNVVVVYDDKRASPFAYCADCGRTDCQGARYAQSKYVIGFMPRGVTPRTVFDDAPDDDGLPF